MSAIPVQKPIVISQPRPQLRVEQGVRPAVRSQVIARTALFGSLALGFFFTSSLAGQVMVEKARRDNIRAVATAKDAAKSVALLRDTVQSMTRSSAIDTWAMENGFVAPEALAAKSPEKDDAEAVH